jgi:hypothetical protein
MRNSQAQAGRGPAAVFWLLTALRALAAIALARGAVIFLRHGQAVLVHRGLPDFARIALSSAEIAGAVLFVFGPTAVIGGVVLLAVLAWAAGFHFAAGLPSQTLWILFFFVACATAATYAARVKPRVFEEQSL